MNRSIIMILAPLMSLMFSCHVFAAQEEKSDTLLQITPRVWFSYLDLVDDEGASTEQIDMPLYGATVAVNPTSSLNFLLTGFYGEGDGDYENTWYGKGTTDVERLDVELLLRYNVPGTKFSVFGGGRYVEFEEESTAGSFRAEDDTNIWMLELGLGVVTDMSDNGRHRLFSNFIVGAAFSDYEYQDTEGYDESDDDVYPALDFNFGYQYVIKSWLSFNARYRAFILFSDNDFDHSRLNTLHGPEVALTVYF